jgi:hypothetical protein
MTKVSCVMCCAIINRIRNQLRGDATIASGAHLVGVGASWDVVGLGVADAVVEGYGHSLIGI